MRCVPAFLAAALLLVVAACGTLTTEQTQCVAYEAASAALGAQPPLPAMTQAQLAVFLTSTAEHIAATDRCNLPLATVEPYVGRATQMALAAWANGKEPTRDSLAAGLAQSLPME